MQKQYSACSLLLAQAVQDLLPTAQRIQSFITDSSFGYDFLYDQHVDDQILPQLQQKFFEKIRSGVMFEIKTMMRENAEQFFSYHKLPIQAALIGARTENLVELCKIGEWYDLISEEPLANSAEIQIAMLTDVKSFSTYYPELGTIQLLRVTGVVFSDKQAMKKNLKQRELAKKSDPIELCRALHILDLHERRPFWLPQGMIIRDLCVQKWKEICKRNGFALVSTPSIAPKKQLRKIISPLEEISRDAAPEIEFELEEELYGISLRFEAHRVLFKNSPYNRFAEFIEKELHCYSKDTEGFFRTKSCIGDILRTFAKAELLEEELISSLQCIQEMATLLHLDLVYTLCFTKETKEKLSCVQALEKIGLSYVLKDEKISLTGPRIEAHVADLRGRSWLVSVVGIEQVERGSDIVVLSGSMLFSLERIVACLVERGKGVLPVWLAPTQVSILAMSAGCLEEAKKVQTRLAEMDIRAELDSQKGELSSRMYECHQKRVPFAVVIGDNEVRTQSFVFRDLREKKPTTYDLNEFLKAHLTQENSASVS